MPYIKKEDRGELDEVAETVAKIIDNSPNEVKDGKLNYLMTKILKKVYPRRYFEFNRAIGLLECIKQEFYRRDVGGYEDEKIKENGDVE